MTGYVVAAAFLAAGFLLAAIVGRAGRAAWQAYEQHYPLESDGIYDWELEPDPDRWTYDLPGRSS